MTSGPWLIDKSALVRLGDCGDREQWAERIERGLVHVTTITLLEAGFSARSIRDLALTGARTPVVWFKVCPVLLAGSAALLVAASLL